MTGESAADCFMSLFVCDTDIRERGSRWRNIASRISVGRSIKVGPAIVVCICLLGGFKERQVMRDEVLKAKV